MTKNRMLVSIVTLMLFSRLAYAGDVHVIEVGGAITPVTAKYINDGLSHAEHQDAECLVIELDTPGGLLQATMEIDKAILASSVPVVVYVSPKGGRAASAGVFITYAAHIAAMAPTTNIGSAHPVTMMGKDTSETMMEKVTNDAVAHIKGLAGKHGRNAEWGESAIRESKNITAKEALQLNVINYMADNLYHLLQQIDGKTVALDHGEKTLHTKDAEIKRSPMNWRYQILDKIADPNLFFILMALAGLGIYFEFSNPGSILPGVIGAICIVLLLFASQVLTINAAGLVFMILGFAFFIIEAYTPVFGILTAGGIIAFILGALMLFKSPDVQVSFRVLIPTVIFMLIFVSFSLYLAMKTRLTKPRTGSKGLIGEVGEALEKIAPAGKVSVHGEIWKAVSEEPIKKGETIEVVQVDGLKLTVKKKSSSII